MVDPRLVEAGSARCFGVFGRAVAALDRMAGAGGLVEGCYSSFCCCSDEFYGIEGRFAFGVHRTPLLKIVATCNIVMRLMVNAVTAWLLCLVRGGVRIDV